MELISLIVYGAINIAMVVSCLHKQGQFYQFPFWAGVIGLGWFYPQAIGGFSTVDLFPDGAYTKGMLFASFCSVAMWVGYILARDRQVDHETWLDAQFTIDRLYQGGAALVVFGFFFQWKVWSMPEEVLSQTQWSGAVVKYLFLASVFKFGFVALWLLYISQDKILVPRFLIFIVPCLLALLDAAFVAGRRADMMNLVSYLAVSMWFVRRVTIPRWMVITGISMSLVLVNSIETYRSIMLEKDKSLSERISSAFTANYSTESERVLDQSGLEFQNYIFYRQMFEDEGTYDFGSIHWNGLIFNYVPAQLVGRGVKEALMIPQNTDWIILTKEKYGHSYMTGTTMTGYNDAFGSFSWFGFIKFLLIGGIMGTLYRHAMQGRFLGQLLYVYALGTAMHAVSHGTNHILLSVWVYFFLLAFPVFYWAKLKPGTV